MLSRVYRIDLPWKNRNKSKDCRTLPPPAACVDIFLFSIPSPFGVYYKLMDAINVLSAAEQVAEHLRNELLRGALSGSMPGAHPLAEELGVNHKTVKAALQLLEKKGLLVGQGAGRRRKIVLPEDHAPVALRVALLVFDFPAWGADYMIELKHQLEVAGHVPVFTDKTLEDLGMDAERVARFVKKTGADAWVVSAGTSEVLQWFLQQKIPAFAIFGRQRQLKIAGVGPDKIPALVETTQRLIELGHQRIVFLDSLYKFSDPGVTGTAFLDALSAGGITVGSYNLPGWEGGLEGLYAYLDSSFRISPPTAIFAGSASTYFATLHFLLSKDIHVPRDLSLICVDDDPYFKQCQPSVSRIRWSSHSVANSIVRWVWNISQGKEDTRQTTIKAEFVEGGTIGPVGGNSGRLAGGAMISAKSRS